MTLEELIQTSSGLASSGRQTAAIRLYEDWLRSNPSSPYRHVGLFNLAVLYTDSNQPAQAEVLLREAVALAPFFSQAYFNLGMTSERQGRKDEALAYWQKIVDLMDSDKQDSKEMAIAALNQIGRLQENLKRYPEAEQALRQSLLLDPKQPDAIQHWVHLRQKQCEWPVYQEFGDVREYDMFTATSPLAMLAMFDDPVKQLMAAQTFNSRKFNYRASKSRPAPYNHVKTRIGYVSGDLCTHAVGLLLPGFLENHDKSKVELYAYDYSPEDGSPTRERLKACFDVFTDIRSLSNIEVSQLVRQHEIDVLIDMHGLSSGARPEIFIDRPAPIQCTWLGFIGTTAFEWIDYVLADSYSVPAELEKYFSEKVIHLQGSLLPRHSIGRNLEESRAKGASEPIVYGNFNNIYKLNPQIVGAWVQIIDSVPNSEMWLLDDNPKATQNLKSFLLKESNRPEAFKFLPRCLYGEYRDRLQSLDVYIDTYPYNAGSTAGDVLACGVPFLTLSGQTMVSRMGGSVLNELGLNSLIARSVEDYIAKAINLGRDRVELQNLKAMTQAFLQKLAVEPKVRAQSFEDAVVLALK